MEGILESRADLDVDPGVMVLELILFLKDWGLWIDINIFATNYKRIKTIIINKVNMHAVWCDLGRGCNRRNQFG